MSEAGFVLQTAMVGLLFGTLSFNIRSRRLNGLISQRRMLSRVSFGFLGMTAFTAYVLVGL